MRVLTIKKGAAEYRDATPEEIEEMKRMMAEMPMPETSPEDRLAILENALLELGAMLGGVV